MYGKLKFVHPVRILKSIPRLTFTIGDKTLRDEYLIEFKLATVIDAIYNVIIYRKYSK
jgi:hypothetical protein